jgi:glycosyltransferase involved in cell wall biosynthesis
MKKECLLSVIIPAYNAEKTIGRAVISIGRQFSEQFEVIVIDDGSTDATAGAFHYVAGDNASLLRLEENYGQAAARSIGIQNAKGKYISFVDADDWVDDAYTSSILKEIKLNADVDLFLFGIRNHNLGAVQEIASGDVADILSAFILDDLFCSPCSKVYRRSIINKYAVGFGEMRPGEDIVFNARFLVHTTKHKTIADLYYNYDCRQPSTTRRPYTFDVIEAHQAANEIVRRELACLVVDFDNKFFARSFRFLFMHSMWRMARDRADGVRSDAVKAQVESFLISKFRLLEVIRSRYLSPKEKLVFVVFKCFRPLAYSIFAYQVSRLR